MSLLNRISNWEVKSILSSITPVFSVLQILVGNNCIDNKVTAAVLYNPMLATHTDWLHSTLLGHTPLNTVPILSCVKAFSKNRHFRGFIMIETGQTHVFLKDYVHIRQMRSHFVSGYRLGIDFSQTEQETKTSILQTFSTR